MQEEHGVGEQQDSRVYIYAAVTFTWAEIHLREGARGQEEERLASCNNWTMACPQQQVSSFMTVPLT